MLSGNRRIAYTLFCTSWGLKSTRSFECGGGRGGYRTTLAAAFVCMHETFEYEGFCMKNAHMPFTAVAVINCPSQSDFVVGLQCAWLILFHAVTVSVLPLVRAPFCGHKGGDRVQCLSLIHISEPTRPRLSRMPSSA